MLQFKHYKKKYNTELILDIDNMTINDGVYWIEGSNGTGKSTLMKCIAGIIPFEGEILVCGVANDQKNMLKYRRIINYGEAEPAYPEFMKGNDLIEFYKNIRHAKTEQVENLVKKFGVDKFQMKEIGTYSSGMKKKLSLALAFIGSPQLILLDEPLITLDKETTDIVLHLISEYASKNVSVIFTSHQEFKDKLTIPLHHLVINQHQLNLL